MFCDWQRMKINRLKAGLYCMFRLWKNDENDKSNRYFAREFVLIENNLRNDTEHRYKCLASRWDSLPEDEKKAFNDRIQSKD